MANDVFSVATWHCVHFMDSFTQEPASDESRVVVEINGEVVDGDAALFREVASAFEFPDYFGRNWDALDECLQDLEWLPGSSYVLVLRHARSLWRVKPECAGALVQAWLTAAEQWAAENVPFHLVFSFDD